MTTSPLAYEKVWLEKCKYDEAERQYFEKLAKLLINNGLTCDSTPTLPSPVINIQSKVSPKPMRVSSPVKKIPPNSAPVIIKKDPSPVPVGKKEVVPPPTSSPLPQMKDEKRFKPKEAKEKRNKADKKGRDRRILKDDIKGSPNTPLKNSLAGEVAKARQHIKNSLECMDGIAALATNVNVELVNRLNSLEKTNTDLIKLVADLQGIVKQLESRVKTLETGDAKQSSTVSPAVTVPKSPAAPVKKEEKDDDEDDGVDLFGSDSEEESEAAKKVKEERLAAYAAKKSKKPVLIAKSNIILDVKPWDDETDMKELEKAVRVVKTDGLLWGASKLVPLAYGIHKLQISCVVEDDKVSVDWLQETLEAIEEYVQSVDIAAFNKV